MTAQRSSAREMPADKLATAAGTALLRYAASKLLLEGDTLAPQIMERMREQSEQDKCSPRQGKDR